MAGWSKPEQIVGLLSCRDLCHSWTDSCLRASMDMFLASAFGSARFFTLMYACQYLTTIIKKKKKKNFKEFLHMTAQSILFGTVVSTVTISTSCLLRNLLGRYYLYTVIFLPASVAGFGIFLESQKGKELTTNAFVNCMLEFLIRTAQDNKILTWNKTHQTFVFMICSSLLSYLLSSACHQQHYFWFFMPPKMERPNNEEMVCFHKGKCWKYILNLFIMYSTTGFVLQLIRLSMTNLNNPKNILFSLKNPKTFKLAAFLGSYVVIYEVIRCYLYSKEKKYVSAHDGIAGFLAGVTFKLQPTLTILNSGIITMIQILTEMAWNRKLIPNIPYLETVFIISCGWMFHTKLFFSESCPQLMQYLMTAMTYNRVDWAVENWKKITKSTLL